MKKFLALLATVVLFFGSSVDIYATETQPAYTIEMVEQDLSTIVNSVRLGNNVPELTVTEELTIAAAKRAEEIAATGIFSHVRPDGTPFYTVDFVNAWGENLGRYKYAASNGEESIASLAMDTTVAWCNSETHLGNILNAEYTMAGYGVAKMADGTYVVVQLFGMPE